METYTFLEQITIERWKKKYLAAEEGWIAEFFHGYEVYKKENNHSKAFRGRPEEGQT